MPLDKSQAEAAAQAILAPGAAAQEEVRQRRAAGAMQMVRKRKVAWFALAGSCTGAAAGFFGDVQFALGVTWGGLAGAAIGWLATRRAA